jgi:hypothetical protein
MGRRRRKNFLLTLFLLLFFWAAVVFIVYFINPESVKDVLVPNSYFPFFVSLFFALFFTMAIMFANSRRALLISLAAIALLNLKLHALANILNFLLIVGCVVTLEYYFTRHS